MPASSAAIAISAWVLPGVQISIRSMSSRSISARQSVSADAQPILSAAARTPAAFRPAIAVSSGRSGRSKNRGAVRHACEWAAPMNA